MKDKEQDLLKPRYKVIASDTSGNVIKGDILTYDDECGLFWVRGEPFGQDRLKEYPHLFQPLQWWEERDEKDMPEYVKEEGGKIHKVKYYEQYNELWMESFDGNTKSTWCVNDRTMSFFEPAPETEYNDYITNKQNS